MANPFDLISSVVPDAGFFLKIIPVNDDGNVISGEPFVLQYNPQSFSIKEELDFEQPQEQGKPGNDPQYKGIKPREFTIEFTIDSSGLFTSLRIPVIEHVRLFRSLTTIPKSKDHRPQRLIVQYGTFLSSCNLVSSEITYTLFDREGIPLRAKVKAGFQETKDNELNQAARQFSSPDVTHQYTVELLDE
ncbi:MAG: hypothetical protein KDC61_15380, partial [Saprospiraceae bacterium]|nr:hypothetical protein [Saprospiraceae bacterium]